MKLKTLGIDLARAGASFAQKLVFLCRGYDAIFSFFPIQKIVGREDESIGRLLFRLRSDGGQQ